VPFDSDIALKRANAPKAIPLFREIIEEFPDTDYADLSYVQLGMCYEYLERWEDAEKAYGELIARYTDQNGNAISPSSQNVVQAVQFAINRKPKITAYRLPIKAKQ
jgi:tetratricopeptide (TPR) repeat protein